MSSNRGLCNNRKMFYTRDKRVIPNASSKRIRKISTDKNNPTYNLNFNLSGVAAILLLYQYAPTLDSGIKAAISFLILFSSLHFYKKED